MRGKSLILVSVLAVFMGSTAYANDPFLKEAEAAKQQKKAAPKKKARKAKRRFVQKRRVTLPIFRPGAVVAAAAKEGSEVKEPPKKVAVLKPAEPIKKIEADKDVKAEVAAKPKPAPADKPKAEAKKIVAKAAKPLAKKTKPKAEIKEPVQKVAKVAEKVEATAKPKPKQGVVYKAPEAPKDKADEVVKEAKKVTPKVQPAPKPKVAVKAEPKKVVEPVKKAEIKKPKSVDPKPVVAVKKPVAKPETKPEKVVVANPVVPKPKKIEPEGAGSTGATAIVPKAKPVAKKAEVAKAEKKPETKPAKTDAEVQVAKVEPQVASTDVNPIKFGERPKKFTRALRDKRLRRLPGPKTRGFKPEEVIAIRHHALMLLKEKECSGITKGGRAVTRGMLFVVCSDDPTYIRQFPLEEQTW